MTTMTTTATAQVEVSLCMRRLVIDKLQKRRDPADFGATDDQIFATLLDLPSQQMSALAGWLFANRKRQYGTRNGAVNWPHGLAWLRFLAYGRVDQARGYWETGRAGW